jgi:hypothetical protein
MELIDEQGDLLGVVNVVDALAVIALIAVVGAGVVLVSGGGLPGDSGSQPARTATPNVTSTATPAADATRYVTIELGTQPTYVVEQMSPGDVVAEVGNDAMTLTDVYASPVGDRKAAVTVRVRVDGHYPTDGPRQDATIRFANRTVRPGSDIAIGTSAYEVSGTVVRVDRDGDAVPTETVTATVTLDAVSPERAAALEVGMREQSVAGTYARLVDKRSDPAEVVVQDGDGNLTVQVHPVKRDVTLSVQLTVQDTGDGYRYDGKPLTVGATVSLDFRTITVQGTVDDFEGS